jgi:uroporphyrinogen decarboxylase
MTAREILLNSLKHKSNPDNIVPYTIAFDCPVLEEKVNRHYGGRWQDKARGFMISPFNISTTREVPIEGRAHYARDVFGSIWFMGQLPWHLETPVLPEPSFAGYTFPTIDDFVGDLEKSNAKKYAKEQYEQNPEYFRLINMGWGIFEQSWRIRGFEDTMCDIAAEQEFYAELVDKIADLYVQMVEYCADVEADAFLFGDDWGSQNGVIIGPLSWRKFIKPAWKRVYDEVHKQGKYVISHCCGSAYDIIPDAIEIGLDMLESVQPEAYGMDPFKLKAEFGDKIGFWGTLGSQSVIPFWKPEDIKTHIRKLKSEMNVNGGYILAPAKPFQSETPVENAVAVIDALCEG